MEGNIVFRQGDRTVYADRMFYDVRRQIGIILNAELLTPVPADQRPAVRRPGAAAGRRDPAARQLALRRPERPGHHQPLEEPSYAFTAETLTFQDNPAAGHRSAHRHAGHRPRHRPTGRRSPAAGRKPEQLSCTSPACPCSTGRRSRPISRSRATTSTTSAFATIRSSATRRCWSSTRSSSSASSRSHGVEWDLNLDYLSERGLGFGTGVEYARDSFFNLTGPTTGRADAWFINDDGLDNLGLGRRDIVPEEEFRGRAFWNHRQHLVGGLLDDWTVQAEVGWLSDRTFLEQYYESEWDENKDQLTGVRLKRTFDNQSFSIEANGRVNDFFTQTQWLPRLDHYWLGQPLVDDQLTWFEHSSAAYANIGIASAPTNPQLPPNFELLPWEDDSAGTADLRRGRAVRHAAGDRLADRPGAVQGRAVRARRAGPLGRGHQRRRPPAGLRPHRRAGQHSVLGRRSDDPRPAVQPQRPGAQSRVRRRSLVRRRHAQTSLSFRCTTSWTMTRSKRFRRRLFFSPFGGGLAGMYYIPGAPSFIDPKFDPRFYALRSGLQGWVTSPSTEIADDLTAVRMGMRHRLQTKRGPLGEERIIDWLTFDSNATWFPDGEPRQRRRRHRPDRLRPPLAPRRSLLDPLRRLRRHVRRRPADRLDRHAAQSARARQRLPRLPHDRRRRSRPTSSPPRSTTA